MNSRTLTARETPDEMPRRRRVEYHVIEIARCQGGGAGRDRDYCAGGTVIVGLGGASNCDELAIVFEGQGCDKHGRAETPLTKTVTL